MLCGSGRGRPWTGHCSNIVTTPVSVSRLSSPNEQRPKSQKTELTSTPSVHENRLRQAASSLGAAQYCITSSIRHAQTRQPFGTPLSSHQAIQFPIVELSTQAEMLELLILRTAVRMDGASQLEIERDLGGQVSMCNVCTCALPRICLPRPALVLPSVLCSR